MYAMALAFGDSSPVVSMFVTSESAWESFFESVKNGIPVACRFEGQKDGQFHIGKASYSPCDKKFEVYWF